MNPTSILDIRHLTIEYRTFRGRVNALRDVNLKVPQGSFVGIVGESGCGKSTLIMAILRLLSENAEIRGGKVLFEGKDILKMSQKEMRDILGRRISVVFQDPMTSLNPVVSIGTQMTDIQYREKIRKSGKKKRAARMLEKLGIPDAESRLKQYPHHFSGGMRQRIAIAMALLSKPALLIADEPTTALDETMQIQILNRLRKLQQELDCAVLFISHNLCLVSQYSDYVGVMYAGEMVEYGTVKDVFQHPGHPYTRALLSCDPAGLKEKAELMPTIAGEIPNLINLPETCIFSARCLEKAAECKGDPPEFTEAAPGHYVRCHCRKGAM